MRILINGSVSISVPFVNDCDSILKIKLLPTKFLAVSIVNCIILINGTLQDEKTRTNEPCWLT